MREPGHPWPAAEVCVLRSRLQQLEQTWFQTGSKARKKGAMSGLYVVTCGPSVSLQKLINMSSSWVRRVKASDHRMQFVVTQMFINYHYAEKYSIWLFEGFKKG